MSAKPVPTWLELQDSRAFPAATVAILAITITVTLVQIAVPELRLHLWRDQRALQSGEFWRLVTPLLIQYDPPRDAAIVLGLIAFIGTAVERVYGAGRLVCIYVICGVVGQAFGYLWEPPDAGASVAGAGLLGALSAWLLSPRSGAPLRARLLAGLAVIGGLTLTVRQDMHGPPLLVGCALGTLMRIRAT
jgi:rhomboid protease GluP